MNRLLFVTSVLASFDAFAAAPAVRRFALIAGANDGGTERVRLRYATKDARAVAQVLEELGGIQASDRMLVLDPGRADLLSAFAAMHDKLDAARASAKRVELLLYYSGHSDEDGLLLQGERVAYGELRRLLDDSPADVRIAILDSCASGALTRKKGGKACPPFLLDESAAVRGHAFLTSSSEHESAQESDRLGASFFTHYFISGLRGAADVTADARVTLNEAYQFAFHETLSRTERTQGGPQHAAYDIQLAGTGDLVLTDIRSTDAGLQIAAELSGRIYVRDANGQLVAELFKPAGRPMTLGLPPGNYRVTVDETTRVAEAQLVLEEGGQAVLGPSALEAVELEATALRGGKQVVRDASGEEITVVPAIIGLWPGLSTYPDEDVISNFAFNMIYGRTRQVWGMALSLGANVVAEDMRGLSAAVGFNDAGRLVGAQLTAGVNHVSGDVTGVQSAALFNYGGGTVGGIQGASLGNVAGGALVGVQGAGVFNYTAASIVGIQGAGVLNYAGASVVGAQLASVANVARGDVEGLQGSAVVNVARDVRGVQASVVNISKELVGAQVGVVNVVGKSKGLLLGVVNVAESLDGVPIGLINIIGDGLHHLETYTTSTEPLNAAIKLGSRHVYTRFSAGLLRRGRDGERIGPGDWYAGFGVGGHIPLPLGFLEVDATGANPYVDVDERQGGELLVLTRVLYGVQIFDHLGVFAGAGYNGYFGWEQDRPGIGKSSLKMRRTIHDGDLTFRRWPTVFAGVQI